MTNSKHTPGPWKADHEGGYIFTNDGQMMVGQVRGWGTLKYKGEEIAIAIQEANGTLMAAAPEMLGALELALVRLRNADPRGVETDTYKICSKAIAKAKDTP